MSQAELAGPADTPYANKYFFLQFSFTADFPSTPPTAHFLTKVYHPNVDNSTGAICVNTLKRDWKPTHTISHVLRIIRCLLIVPFPESSLNEDAGKLFMESYAEYYKRAALHADIHGRPLSIAGAKDEARILQTASGNTSPKVSPSGGDENGAMKKMSTKSKLKKKKSLKRL